jgi:hypothetical protein
VKPQAEMGSERTACALPFHARAQASPLRPAFLILTSAFFIQDVRGYLFLPFSQLRQLALIRD